MTVLDKVRAHANASKRRFMEVPEWGDDASPLIVSYAMVTLDDLAVIDDLGDTQWPHRAARIVAMKACDADGKRLFKDIDARLLRQEAAPEVVQRIAMAMLGRMSKDELAKK